MNTPALDHLKSVSGDTQAAGEFVGEATSPAMAGDFIDREVRS